MPSASKRGANVAKSIGEYCRKVEFKVINSGFVVTPGNVLSLGVPSILNIKYNSSSTLVPGNSGLPYTIS